METREKLKGKLSHASARAERFHGGINSSDVCWKNQREMSPSWSTWQRERRQAGGTDDPGGNYFFPDSYRKHKKHILHNSSLANYLSMPNTDGSYRCSQNHRSTRNKISIVNNMGMARKGNDIKEDIENDADDDEDDDDEYGDDPYYDDEANVGEEVEENQDESCGSFETNEKDRDFEEEVDNNYKLSPNSRRIQRKSEKNPLSVIERLKFLDFAQEKLKQRHQRHLQKKYQERVSIQRCCQDFPEHDVTDEATEDDEEIALPSFPIQKMTKKPICRDPNSWLQSAHQVKYNPIRSSPQSYHYSRKNESTKLHLEPSVESYSQKKPCRFCGGTGSYPNEAAVSRKNNCRVHEPTKVSFSTKEKFAVDGESGEPGERCSSGRRNLMRSNFANIMSEISPATLSSLKPRRSRNRSPTRG